MEQIGLWCNDGRLLQSPACKRGNGIVLEQTRGRGVADLVTVMLGGLAAMSTRAHTDRFHGKGGTALRTTSAPFRECQLQ